MGAGVPVHKSVLSGVLLLGLMATFGPLPAAAARSLEAIKASGRLVVLTRNAPTTWYIGRDDQPAGPEYELVEAFAASLGVQAEYVLEDSVADILAAIERGEGDLAAAGLTITPQRSQRYRFGPPYQPVTQQVVCRRGGVQPQDLRELSRVRVAVIADSSYAELLHDLEQQGYRTPEWTEVENTTTEELLRRVWQRELPCTVADSTIVAINRRYYPELVTPMRLSREQQLGWVLPRSSRELDAVVTRWLKSFRNSGRLETLQEKYYGFFEQFDYVDTRRLMRRMEERLPRYLDWFRDASAEHGFPWTLLAAQAYQESHWNPRARSPTGVRGMMMLTQTTAQALGIEDRLDPRQSIYGGARYLARMKDRFTSKVREPDRTWLALASYNVGRAHMHDAQVLARQRGLSPYHWRDIKRVLPLLAKPSVYRKLKYGYARGWEPVRYVQRVREYHHILSGLVTPPLPNERLPDRWLQGMSGARPPVGDRDPG